MIGMYQYGFRAKWCNDLFCYSNGEMVKPVYDVKVIVEPSPGYPIPYRIPEYDTSKTTIYDREISYGQTFKPT